MTVAYLFIFVIVGTIASILFTARRSRPRPHQPLSDSCASAAFRDQEEEARGRGHG